jgi:hypothetical protein
MDVSKQGFSAGLLHVLNLYLSTSAKDVDACVWYFLNFFIDTVVGMGLCYLILHLVERCLRNSPIFNFKSGHYGENNDVGIWAYQMFIWLSIILLMKLIIWTTMTLFHHPLEYIGEIVLTPFSFNPDVELVTVMIVIPLIVNSAYFWITDNFLKAHQKKIVESETELLPDQQKNKYFY